MKKLFFYIILSLPLLIYGFDIEKLIVSLDADYVNISGDNMTGQLTTSSTITVQGNAFSVGTSTFVVKSGNVGIGITNPTQALDVNGAIYSSNYISTGNSIRALFWLGDSFYFRNSDNTIRWMTLKTGGNVGIGTTDPSARLHIAGSEVRVSTATTSQIHMCFAGAVQDLPTTGYNEGCLIYQNSDNTLYVSTETVSVVGSWKPVW